MICKLVCTAYPDVVDYYKELQYFSVQRAKFAHRYGTANVCCAIDGTFIKIQRTSIMGERYYIRYKQVNGLNVLSVVDYNGAFLYLHIGYPESVHDMAIFSTCTFYQDIINGACLIGPDSE